MSAFAKVEVIKIRSESVGTLGKGVEESSQTVNAQTGREVFRGEVVPQPA